VTAARPRGRFAPVLVAAGAMLPMTVTAQGVVDVRPTVTITQLHDSNLLAAAAAPRADFITRLTPSFDTGYRTPAMDMRAHYTFDAERYANAVELSHVLARQQAGFEVEHSPASRLSWRAAVGATRTWTPGELLPETGLLLPRGRAIRLTAQSSLTRRLNMRTDGTIEYTLSDDRIEDGLSIQTHTAGLHTVRRLSPRTTTRVGYRAEWYEFGPDRLVASPSTAAHSFAIGWTRALSPRTSLSLEAGPRLAERRVRPDLRASIQSTREAVTLSLAYLRTQTVVIGVARPVAVETVTGRIVWGSAHGPQAHVAPGLFRSTAGAGRVDSYQVEIGLEWPIADTLALELMLDGHTQSGRLHAAPEGGTISRHTSLVRLAVRPPGRRSR